MSSSRVPNECYIGRLIWVGCQIIGHPYATSFDVGLLLGDGRVSTLELFLPVVENENCSWPDLVLVDAVKARLWAVNKLYMLVERHLLWSQILYDVYWTSLQDTQARQARLRSILG